MLTSVLLRASSKTQEDGGKREKKESRVQEKGENSNVTSDTLSIHSVHLNSLMRSNTTVLPEILPLQCFVDIV